MYPLGSYQKSKNREPRRSLPKSDRQPGRGWLRIARALHDLGVVPVSRFADDDAGAPCTEAANEAVALGATGQRPTSMARHRPPSHANVAWMRAPRLRLPEQARDFARPARRRACASSAPRRCSWRCSATSAARTLAARCGVAADAGYTAEVARRPRPSSPGRPGRAQGGHRHQGHRRRWRARHARRAVT